MEYSELVDKIANKKVKNFCNSITYDSRKVSENDIFVCIRGFNVDGHSYGAEAVKKGAKIIVCEEPLKLNSEIVIVSDSRKALAELSSFFYNNPSAKMKLFGVTGTNGKTTTTFMIDSIMKYAGLKTGLIGTIGNKIGDREIKSNNTTPESLDLQKLFHNMVSEDIQSVSMEVSSHALELKRVWNCYFDGVLYTNFSQDHLDFHSTLEDYWKVKAGFLSLQKTFPKEGFFSVFNGDDHEVIKLLPEGNGRKFIYGFKNRNIFNLDGIPVFAYDISLKGDGTYFKLDWHGKTYDFKLKLMGSFNIHNSLAAICTGLSQDIDLEIIKEAIGKMDPVPGRIYPIATKAGFSCIVDYAHTPDGLEKILKAAREFTTGRVIAVFGCGGDRDKTKRPLMGTIGAELSDVLIITSDNPRSEEPLSIICDIEKGIGKILSQGDYIIEPDRRIAIGKAIDMAVEGDCIVVAGKGHENYQIFKDKTIHFDDSEVIKEFLLLRK